MKPVAPPKIVLMGPGPSHVPDEVLQALQKPTVGHLDPYFIEIMEETKSMLRLVFQTENEVTLPLSAPGSAGMEACIINMLEPGDKFVACQNGVFGGRMAEIGRRCGANVIVIEDDWGHPVSPSKLQETLKAHPDCKAIGFVHAETSTGVLSDAEALCKIAKEAGCLTIVDTVTSLAGVPVKVDQWKMDVVYSGTQKCLSCPPGLSPVTLSAEAVAVLRKRKVPPVSWFLDFKLLLGYWEEGAKRSYHHTAPVNAIYGLHESLRLVIDEGLEKRWLRHRAMHEKLLKGLEELKLEPAVEEAFRIPQLNAILVPKGVDEGAIRQSLRVHHRLEIGAGLGPLAGKIWRIGLMGASATEECVDHCLQALKQTLQ